MVPLLSHWIGHHHPARTRTAEECISLDAYHVRSSDAEAKFWLEAEVTLARNDGFDAKTLRRLARITKENRKLLEAAWHEHFAPDSPL
ncbi:MAG: DUF4160 domain-containing protein [Pseudomonadota bacterium]